MYDGFPNLYKINMAVNPLSIKLYMYMYTPIRRALLFLIFNWAFPVAAGGHVQLAKGFQSS